MIATGLINSLLFGSMGMCKQSLQKDPNTPPTIYDTMICGAVTGNYPTSENFLSQRCYDKCSSNANRRYQSEVRGISGVF